MNDVCNTLEKIYKRFEAGEDIENIIPYDLSGFSKECIIEIFALYIKYGKNEERKAICKKGYDELC